METKDPHEYFLFLASMLLSKMHNQGMGGHSFPNFPAVFISPLEGTMTALSIIFSLSSLSSTLQALNYIVTTLFGASWQRPTVLLRPHYYFIIAKLFFFPKLHRNISLYKDDLGNILFSSFPLDKYLESLSLYSYV